MATHDTAKAIRTVLGAGERAQTLKVHPDDLAQLLEDGDVGVWRVHEDQSRDPVFEGVLLEGDPSAARLVLP